MSRGLRFLLLVVLLVPALTLVAGETGSISGKVADATGGALPGVMVKVSGPQLPAGRTSTTGATGQYNFQKLLPGTYTVEASLQGLGKAAVKINVEVDNDVQVPLTLKQGAATEVLVTAGLAEIDKKSTEVSINFAPAEIRQIPISRTYSGFLNLIPAAPADTSGIGMVAVAGGTRQDNKYLLDGVNITNPGYGALITDTNELDIADVNVKNGAISAEFGRTNGAIINAVTKSGTNTVKGSARFEMSPASFSAQNSSGVVTQDTDLYSGAANVGFPIIKDMLFGYVSGRYAQTTTSGQSATIGGVTTTQPDTTTKTGDYFGKLTAFIGQSLLINAGFRGLPNKVENGYNSVYDAASAAYGSDDTNYVGNLTVDWFVNKDTNVEFKYVHYTEDGTSQASTILTDRPLTIDPTNIQKYGAYSDPARNLGNSGVYAFANNGESYKRDEVKLTASQFLDIGPTQNNLKLGFGAEFTDYDFIRTSNGWGTMTYQTASVPGMTGSQPVVRARYYNLQPIQTGKTRTYSAFLQDTMTWDKLSVNVGVLTNYDDFAQVCDAGNVCGAGITTSTTRYNFMTFRWGDQIQPRLGAVYNADLLKGDKIYANYGEYAGLDQKSTVRSFAPFRIREDQSYFLRSTGVWQYEQIRGSSSGKYIPSDLKAPYQQEFVFGYSAPVARDVTFDIHYQYRNLKDPFEDTPIDPVNWQSSLFQAMTYSGAKRTYNGVTLELTKRYSNNWYANLSYTYSTLRGNWDDDYANLQFNTSSYLQDEPGWDYADPNRNGKLGQDRPHILKAMASYDFMGFTFGGFFRFQSGTPWEARGATWSTNYGRYLEQAGSRRLPSWTNFDLLAAYNLQLVGETTLRFEARVRNVFNTQAVLGVNNVLYNDPYNSSANYPGWQLSPQGTSQPNAQFGQATSWAPPRRFTLSALLSF
jgi:hypothetical protein